MRLRITFSKTGSLRYTGHLDLHTVWERTIRRAGLQLMYTQGFHPGPRIQIASALPLGFSGCGEIVDVWLEDREIPKNILENPDSSGISVAGPLPFHSRSASRDGGGSNFWNGKIQPAAPPGLTILSVEEVDERSPALQTQVVSAEYEVEFLDPPLPGIVSSLAGKITALLEAEKLPAERRGKQYDLRPLIEKLAIGEDAPGPMLKIFMRLAAREGATGRPEAVLQALSIPPESTRIERMGLILRTAAASMQSQDAGGG